MVFENLCRETLFSFPKLAIEMELCIRSSLGSLCLEDYGVMIYYTQISIFSVCKYVVAIGEPLPAQFPFDKMGINIKALLIEVLGGLSELIQIKNLEQCLALSQCSASMSYYNVKLLSVV